MNIKNAIALSYEANGCVYIFTKYIVDKSIINNQIPFQVGINKSQDPRLWYNENWEFKFVENNRRFVSIKAKIQNDKILQFFVPVNKITIIENELSFNFMYPIKVTKKENE